MECHRCSARSPHVTDADSVQLPIVVIGARSVDVDSIARLTDSKRSPDTELSRVGHACAPPRDRPAICSNPLPLMAIHSLLSHSQLDECELSVGSLVGERIPDCG